MTCYYIHPQTGSDENLGLREDEAWKGFGPLLRHTLGEGDRVEVLAPGFFDESLRIVGKGSLDRPIVVSFATGRYDLFPDKMEKRKFNISNANSDAESEKTIAFFLKDNHHLQIEGEGAIFFCRGKMIEVCVEESIDIRIKGLTFDYHRPTVSEWTVLEASEGKVEIEVHPDSKYEIHEGKIEWIGEGWSEKTGLAQELIPDTMEVWRRKDPLINLEIEEVFPGRLLARGDHDMTVGRVYQLRNPFRDCTGVFLNHSKDVRFEKVHFAFMHGMGVLCQFSENISLEDVKISPREESGRTSSAWADCTHFSGCRGKIVLRNCMFNGAHDDAVNVHGTHLRILEKTRDDQIKVAFMHNQTFGFQAFFPGDEVEYVHGDSLEPFGIAKVKCVEILSEREQLLTLDSLVPSGLREGDALENVTWTPEVEIRGCRAEGIPTRGFLLTTRKKVLVEDNTFVALGHGIHVESDAEGWFESGCVRDMEIRGNRFESGKGPAIRISPHYSKKNSAVHHNIRITENRFDLSRGFPAVKAHGVKGLKLRKNLIKSGEGDFNGESYAIEDCEDVEIVE